MKANSLIIMISIIFLLTACKKDKACWQGFEGGQDVQGMIICDKSQSELEVMYPNIWFYKTGEAQEIPLGSCGIVYIYDAAGNRIKRIYFCNNGGPYPSFAQTSSSKGVTDNTIEFQQVDALYPNPTSGIFYITFSKALSKAPVRITDINGKIVQQNNASGDRVSFDLSAVAAGIYFIRIEDEGKIIINKVVKL